uniref:AfsR/SARP family transcriptional regulator n=1 Tax=Streptomyces polyasparticus TaxID=2767826 RepID=UPI001BE46CF8|nr:BTAD domain-containing putative transcriptional regulator [Streptomyces polyasparticus]
MRFEVLGPLRVRTEGGATLTVPEAKVRALLATLLAHAGHPIGTDRLIEDLWNDAARPANAPNALQTKVSQLRRALERGEPGARTLVEFGPAGYRLAVRDEDVDATRFGELVTQARKTRDPRTQASLLSDALGLWRGTAFDGFRDAPYVRTAVARLEEQRITAQEKLASLRVDLGEHAQLADELAALVAEHPLREGLRAVQMRALYRSGRQSEALATYHALSRHLADDLGLDPGPELRALYEAMLRQDPILAPDLAPDLTPGSIPAPVGTSARGPAPSGSRPPTNLPARPDAMIGRAAAVARVCSLLATQRLVTLTGPGGVGKTRLALEAASHLVPSATAVAAGTPGAESPCPALPDGVWLVELAGVRRDPVDAVAAALGIRDEPSAEPPPAAQTQADARPTPAAGNARADNVYGKDNTDGTNRTNGTDSTTRTDRTTRLLHALADRDLLLVLDNCEHLMDEIAALVGRLLRAAPGIRVLATSQEPLNVTGETVEAITPLEVPEAIALFTARAASAAPGFTLTSANREAVELICRRLDGIPLAIELAATRVRALGVEALADRLHDRFRLLSQVRRDAPARQRTLRAMIDWSWELLGPSEQAVLRRLAVFAGGFTLDAAEAVCAAPQPGPPAGTPRDGSPPASTAPATRPAIHPDDVLDLVARLVDRSLLTLTYEEPYEEPHEEPYEEPHEEPYEGRYEERYEEPHAGPHTERHEEPHDGKHTKPDAEPHERPHSTPSPRYRMLESVAAYSLEQLAAAGEEQATRDRHARHYTRLAEHAAPRLHDAAQRTWLRRLDAESLNLHAALDHTRDPNLALRMVNSLTWYWYLSGRLSEGLSHLNRALTTAQTHPADLADPATLTATRIRRAALALIAGDASHQAGPFEGADARGRWLLAYARCGFTHAPDRGRLHALEAEFRALGDAWGEAAALSTWATRSLYEGDLASLREAAEAAAARFTALGDRWGRAQATELLGVLAEITGDYPSAARLHGEGLRVAEELRLWTQASFSLSRLGRIALLTGAYDRATEYHERAARLASGQGHAPARQFAAIGLALGARHRGDLDTAESLLAPWLDWNRRLGVDSGTALLLVQCGYVAEQRGDSGRAESLHAESLAVARRTGDARAIAFAVEGLAGAWAARSAATPDAWAARSTTTPDAMEQGAPGPDPGAQDPAIRAAEALGLAAALRASVDSPLPAAERTDVDRATARARAALGEAAFEEAYARGEKTPPADFTP